MAGGRQGRFFISGTNRLRRKLRRMPEAITREVSDTIVDVSQETEEVMRHNWVTMRPPRLADSQVVDLHENIKKRLSRRAGRVESAEVGFSKKFGTRHWYKRQGFIATFLEKGAEQFKRYPRSGLAFIDKTRRDVFPKAIRRIDTAVDRALQRFTIGR